MAKDTKKSKKPANPMTQDETYRKLPKNSEMVDAKDIDQPYYDMSPKTEAQRVGSARRNFERSMKTYFDTLDLAKTMRDPKARQEVYDNAERAGRASSAASEDYEKTKQQAGYRKGGMVKEKGTGEKYASKKAMMKHERKESPAMERSEYRKGGAVMCRGGGLVARKRPTKVC